MSDKKGSRVNHQHANRRKKRKYHGNQYSRQSDTEDTEFTSASAQKIGHVEMEVPADENFGYCILDFASVFAAISSNVICKNCKSEVFFLSQAYEVWVLKLFRPANVRNKKR